MKYKIVFSIFIVEFLLIACSGSLPTKPVDLDGSAWVLTAINNDAAIIGNPPTLEFEGDLVAGNAGCNTFRGSYQTKGETINFGQLARTEMYCMEPEGLMAQEQTYLEILEEAQHFDLVDNNLTIHLDSGITLAFQARSSSNVATPPHLAEQSNQEPPIITSEPIDPTPIHNFELPAGFKEYRDAVTGVSLHIPESWTVTGIIDGKYAIFQSYSEDKYVGGEGLKPGDTKCDLNIRPTDSHSAELIQQWQASSMTTIVSEDEIILNSGLVGQRFVIDNMGQATVFITELNQRVVTLTCYGDFTMVDEIAVTLNNRR